jgi:hypothetical protein
VPGRKVRVTAPAKRLNILCVTQSPDATDGDTRLTKVGCQRGISAVLARLGPAHATRPAPARSPAPPPKIAARQQSLLGSFRLADIYIWLLQCRPATRSGRSVTLRGWSGVTPAACTSSWTRPPKREFQVILDRRRRGSVLLGAGDRQPLNVADVVRGDPRLPARGGLSARRRRG